MSAVETYRWFGYEHLPEGPARNTSALIQELAYKVLTAFPASSEMDAGMRKLLEAKDCFVRAAIEGTHT